MIVKEHIVKVHFVKENGSVIIVVKLAMGLRFHNVIFAYFLVLSKLVKSVLIVVVGPMKICIGVNTPGWTSSSDSKRCPICNGFVKSMSSSINCSQCDFYASRYYCKDCYYNHSISVSYPDETYHAKCKFCDNRLCGASVLVQNAVGTRSRKMCRLWRYGYQSLY